METSTRVAGASRAGAIQQVTHLVTLPSHRRQVDPGIDKVIRAVLANPQRRITVSNAAKIAGINGRHFSTLFRRQMNIPFAAWCRQHRVVVACWLMNDERLSLTAIALRVGYRDLCNLERAFKTVIGINPKQHREQCLSSRRQAETRESR